MATGAVQDHIRKRPTARCLVARPDHRSPRRPRAATGTHVYGSYRNRLESLAAQRRVVRVRASSPRFVRGYDQPQPQQLGRIVERIHSMLGVRFDRPLALDRDIVLTMTCPARCSHLADQARRAADVVDRGGGGENPLQPFDRGTPRLRVGRFRDPSSKRLRHLSNGVDLPTKRGPTHLIGLFEVMLHRRRTQRLLGLGGRRLDRLRLTMGAGANGQHGDHCKSGEHTVTVSQPASLWPANSAASHCRSSMTPCANISHASSM